MKLFFYAASIVVLGELAIAQNGTINSPSDSANQNQQITGEMGYSTPPQPAFAAGAPEALDRVSSEFSNANARYDLSPTVSNPPTNPGTAQFTGSDAGTNSSAAQTKARRNAHQKSSSGTGSSTGDQPR